MSNAKRGVGKWGPRQEQPSKDDSHQWAASRRRYEWKDSYDEDSIAPKDEELESELFGEDNHVNTGINFDKYENIKVNMKNAEDKQIEPVSSFDAADLHKVMKENIELAKYKIPTPVQKYSIPIITAKHDLMACAQTGSGKTAAFLIPVLSQLFGKAKKLSVVSRLQPGVRKIKAEPLVLILAPTRELATQIFDECRRFTYRSMMRPCVVYGGADAVPQKEQLGKGCDVLTATPGRLSDFLDRGIVSLRRVKYLVLDEADRMLEMGFEDEVRKIVEKSDLLGTRQTLMFSATFPRRIQDLAQDFLAKNYIFLAVGRVGGTTSDITQKFMYVEENDKRNELVQLLLQQPPSRTLIFVRSKRGADSLDDYLYNQGFPTTSIHGDRTQREREDALISFRDGKSPILIATAVAARGLDIKNVMHVINYDLCDEIDEYVHRIGRTARVGNKGLATSFYNDRNSDIASKLVRILVECGQEVPDFLKSYAEDIKLDNDEGDDFEDSSTSNNVRKGGSDTTWNNSGNDQRSWDSGQIPRDQREPINPLPYQKPQSSYAQSNPRYSPQPEHGSPVVNLPRTRNSSQPPPPQSFGYNQSHNRQQDFGGSGGFRNPQPANDSDSNAFYKGSNSNSGFGRDNSRTRRPPTNSGNNGQQPLSNNGNNWGARPVQDNTKPQEWDGAMPW